MNRALTFVRSFLVVGILVSGVSRVAASPVTYSSLSLEVNNDTSDVTGTDSQDLTDHATDISNAAPVVTNFFNALVPGSHGTETYDSYVPDYNGPFAFVPTAITATTPVGIGYQGVQPVPAGLSYSGNALLGFNGVGLDNELDLSAPVTAFGTYIVQAGDSGYPDNMSLLLENTNNAFSETIPIGTVGSGAGADYDNIFYFGVTDAANPFNVVILQGTTSNPGGDGFLLDNTTVGAAAVPEPSSLALVCGGLLIGLASLFVRRGTAPLLPA